MAEELSVRLEKFEGPLDLLLHLIEKNRINIYDIPIAEITEQYMAYVSSMEKEDLDLVSEFLVMAATLLDIKARMLLPKEVDEETGEEVDPRAELVERLLEHKKYRLMAVELRDMEFDAARVLYREPSLPDEVAGYVPPVDLDALFGDVTLLKLQKIFEEVMRHREDRIDPQRIKDHTEAFCLIDTYPEITRAQRDALKAFIENMEEEIVMENLKAMEKDRDDQAR